MHKQLLIASVGLCAVAGVAIAHPGHEADADGKQVKRIVIVHRDGSEKEIDVDRITEEATGCKSAAQRIDSNTETSADGKKSRTHLVFCGEKGAKMLAALENARTRLSREAELTEAHRARAIESLDREIAKLKQGQATR